MPKKKKEKRKKKNRKQEKKKSEGAGRAGVCQNVLCVRAHFIFTTTCRHSFDSDGFLQSSHFLHTRCGRRPLTILVCRPLSSLGWCSLASCKKNGVSQQNKVLLKVHIFFPFSLQLPGSWRPSPSLLLKIGAKYAEPIFKPVLAPFFRRCCHPMNCLG